MRRIAITLLLVVAFSCAPHTAPPAPAPATPTPVASAAPARFVPAPPPTEKKPVTETLNGVTITDPYRWLEDQNSPETRAWIERENAYTDTVLGNRPEKQLFSSRIEQLLKSDQASTPIYRNGRFFFTRRAADADVFSIYVRDGLTGTDRLLVDPAPWNPKHTTNVGIEDVTPDGKLMTYYVREGGADETTARFMDVDTGRDVGTPMPLARYFGIAVTPDRRVAYYSKQLTEGSRVFRRNVDGGPEEKLFGDGYTPDKIVSIGMSDDGRWLGTIVYYGSAGVKTDIFLKDLGSNGPFKTVVNDLDARTSFDFAGDTLLLQTNWNAPNDRVMEVSTNDPARANWREIVPENKNAAIQDMSAVGGRLYVRYLENVKPRVVGYDLAGKQVDEVSFDTIGALGGVSGSWHAPFAFYTFSSLAVPPTIYAYDVRTKEKSIFHRRNLPVKSDDFVTEQVWYTSKDGTKVPMFVMYKKGTPRDGSAPAYLTGYGGFNVSQLPSFSTRAVIWAEHGGVYAEANLRGGSEFGEAWHRAGMLGEKQHVFDDFIGAAEALVANKYTSPRHLAIAGGSNGGLLVMATMVQRPDLMHAVLCSYPLVDMLRFHKFLVGSFWVAEYGNPDNPKDFQWIYQYSPYEHVVPGAKYPAVMFVTGDADTRVAPLHARKMTAMLQDETGSANPVLIRYHVSGGHSGGEPVSEQVKNESEILGFLWWQCVGAGS
ncbi:MAG TPA: prolyl oligopeptidase family serine peptidase [Thermoanaerobaculia bacterium]|nr:prolyl oligopeptidase family serine peptidase [Thermoanaerobaculia bacterium]